MLKVKVIEAASPSALEIAIQAWLDTEVNTDSDVLNKDNEVISIVFNGNNDALITYKQHRL
jgi:hypothetical protein